MQFLGYKKKKGKVNYLVDNIQNPTFFSYSPFSRNESLQTVSGRQPVFYLQFKIKDFFSIASGGEIIIEDIDTNKSYGLLNSSIIDLLKAIEDGTISLENGVFRGMFKYSKKGQSYALLLANEDDIQDIDLDLPDEAFE